MKRRRRRRKSKDTSFSLFVGAVVALAVFSYVKAGGETSIFSSFSQNIYVVAVGIVIAAIIIFMLLKHALRILTSLKRGVMFQRHKTIAEVLSMHPKEFEDFVAAVYENQGYRVDEVTSYSGDHGIDVRLSRGGKKYAVQVKRYAKHNVIKENEMREFYGSYAGTKYDNGIFVTTSSFGKRARSWAEAREMTLIDGHALLKMMNSY